MIRVKWYKRYNENTFTLTSYINHQPICNTNLSDIPIIENLYMQGKGVYAWDAGLDIYNQINEGDYLAIIFYEINEVFLGRLLYKFHDHDEIFKYQVDWKTNYNFRNILLFDEGQYYVDVPNEILDTINNNSDIDPINLKKELDGDYVDILNIIENDIPIATDIETNINSIYDFIYNTKEGRYEPRSIFTINHGAVTYNSEELKIYLGTYFPRSLSECYSIMTDIYYSITIQKVFREKKEVNLLDIGSGTGGNLIGFLLFMKDNNLLDKEINILSIDGCKDALEIQKEFIDKYFGDSRIKLRTIHWDNANTKELIKNKFITELNNWGKKLDFVMSFKFVNELYKKNLDNIPLYRSILEILEDYLKDDGFILFADVTDKITSEDFMPIQMSKEIQRHSIQKSENLKVILPLSCAYYNDINPYHECFKSKVFRGVNIMKPRDIEKLCFFVLGKPQLQLLVIREIAQVEEYKTAEKSYNWNYCQCGIPSNEPVNQNVPSAFSIKDNLRNQND